MLAHLKMGVMVGAPCEDVLLMRAINGRHRREDVLLLCLLPLGDQPFVLEPTNKRKLYCVKVPLDKTNCQPLDKTWSGGEESTNHLRRDT